MAACKKKQSCSKLIIPRQIGPFNNSKFPSILNLASFSGNCTSKWKDIYIFSNQRENFSAKHTAFQLRLFVFKPISEQQIYNCTTKTSALPGVCIIKAPSLRAMVLGVF